MVEIEGMIRLLKESPEDFPEAGKGRTVEKLSRLLGMTQTKIKEYQVISHNLTEEGKEAFREGVINKSVAYQLSRLSDDEQKKHLENPADLTIGQIKKEKNNVSDSDTRKIKLPSRISVLQFYENIKEYDTDRSNLKEILKKNMGISHAGHWGNDLNYECSPRGVKINNADEITWSKLISLINEYIPVKISVSDSDTYGVEECDSEMKKEQEKLSAFSLDIQKQEVQITGIKSSCEEGNTESQVQSDNISVKVVWEEEREKLQKIQMSTPKSYVEIRRQEIIVAALEIMANKQ